MKRQSPQKFTKEFFIPAYIYLEDALCSQVLWKDSEKKDGWMYTYIHM